MKIDIKTGNGKLYFNQPGKRGLEVEPEEVSQFIAELLVAASFLQVMKEQPALFAAAKKAAN